MYFGYCRSQSQFYVPFGFNELIDKPSRHGFNYVDFEDWRKNALFFLRSALDNGFGVFIYGSLAEISMAYPLYDNR